VAGDSTGLCRWTRRGVDAIGVARLLDVRGAVELGWADRIDDVV
jgi:hypothetical protein